MTPAFFLSLMAGLTALVMGVHALRRRSRKSALRLLAQQHQMRFAQRDLFRLARRFEQQLPIAGAFDLRVADLIYGRRDARHLCVFTVEYTLADAIHGRRRAGVFCLSETSEHASMTSIAGLITADAELPIAAQYGQLLDRVAKQG